MPATDPDTESDPPAESWPEKIEIERVHRSYLHFCERGGIRHRKTSPQLGIELRRLVPELSRGRRWANGRAGPYVYKVPPLEACRSAFEELIRTEIDWETGEPKRSTYSTQR